MLAKLPRLLLVLPFLLSALAARGQTPTRTPAPAVSPTSVVPAAAMTPAAGNLTPGAGPIVGKTDLYGIPPGTPPGMPAYTITSAGPAALTPTPSMVGGEQAPKTAPPPRRTPRHRARTTPAPTRTPSPR